MSTNNVHNGPQAQQVSNDGAADFARQMANKSSGGAGAEGGDGSNTPFPGGNYYLTKLTNIGSSILTLGLAPIIIKMVTVLSSGIFKQFDSKGFAEGPINKGAASMGAKGGAVADFMAKTVAQKPDFSKIVPDENRPKLQVTEAPVDTSFSPSSFAGTGGGRGGVGGGIVT
jgi:hypothetical protein